MRILVTGASGFIGSAVVPELIAAGHQVVGLARSDASAQALAAAGAEVQRGSLEDLDGLRAAAAASDGVIHLAFNHDFANLMAAAMLDQHAVEALGSALEGSGRPLVIASGLMGFSSGRPATERDAPQVPASANPRIATAEMTVVLASRNVRSSVVRLAVTVHGEGDHAFVPRLIGIAREKGVSGYIGEGANRWPAVHRLDAATLFRLAAESAAAGTVLHGVADEGVPMRDIAEIIGRRLKLPVRSIATENANEHFGWLAPFVGADLAASSTLTRELLAWRPVHAGLIEDLERGHYFDRAAAVAT
jgi:nucleoside-diphosphate-sugar epimerase